MERPTQRNPVGDWLWATFGAAAVLNLVDAVASPEGWAWTAARIAVTAAFSLALVLWLVFAFRQRNA